MIGGAPPHPVRCAHRPLPRGERGVALLVPPYRIYWPEKRRLKISGSKGSFGTYSALMARSRFVPTPDRSRRLLHARDAKGLARAGSLAAGAGLIGKIPGLLGGIGIGFLPGDRGGGRGRLDGRRAALAGYGLQQRSTTLLKGESCRRFFHAGYQVDPLHELAVLRLLAIGEDR